MKKIFSLFLMIFAGFILVSCNNSTPTESTTEPEKNEIITAQEEIPYLLNNEGNINIDIKYDSDDFSDSSYNYSKNLSNLSFVMSRFVKDVETVNKFFTTLKFDEIKTSPNYGKEDDYLSISYTIAKKKLKKDTDLIALSIRGLLYTKEWGNNFNIGLDSHHKGYDIVSDKIKLVLLEYLKDKTNYKLWVTGYSKGGALADLLTVKLDNDIDDNKLNLKKEDIYTYTFEAPASTAKTDKEYKNIHNLVNKNDLIAGAVYEKYGLIRPGNEYNFEGDYANIINNSGTKLKVDEFSVYEIDIFSQEKFKKKDVNITLNEFNKLLLHALFETTGNEKFSLETREKYVKNLQPALIYLFEKLYEAVYNQIDVIKKYVEKKGIMSLAGAIFGDENSLYPILSELFTELKIEYKEAELKEYSIMVKRFLTYLLGVKEIYNDITLTAFEIIGTAYKNAGIFMTMHDPDVTYILLKEYNK